MTRAVLAVLVAVVLGMTATPADARPLHPADGGRVEPVTACARIVVYDDVEVADCAVHICRRHRHHHGHRHLARKHRHHRHHSYGCLHLPRLTRLTVTIQGS